MPSNKSLFVGWKKSAAINTAAVCILSLLLVALLGYGTANGRGVNSSFVIYHGSCQASRALNLFLHLLLNIFATLILASSNFFTQILIAPSRGEINKAHSGSSWKDIGVSSIRNLAGLPIVKACCCLGLVVSSVPIHLFFNSTIFSVQTTGSDYGLTIASEEFLNGGEYFAPGASLWNMRVPFNCTQFDYRNGTMKEWCGGRYRFDLLPQPRGNWNELSDYLNKSSEVNLNISTATAAKQGTNWERLEPGECRAEYLKCSNGLGLRTHRDVVMIVEDFTLKDPSGWTRAEVFPDMATNDSAFWDQLIPLSSKNSLWFTAQCSMSAKISGTESGMEYVNTCFPYLGAGGANASTSLIMDQLNNAGNDDSAWSYYFWDPMTDPDTFDKQMRSGKQQGPMLDVKYCLAEIVESECKIGASNAILLIVAICVLLKFVHCAFILWRYVWMPAEHPLITPGDAVDSFLREPDPVTERMCTLQLSNISKTITRRKAASIDDDDKGIELLRTSHRGRKQHRFLFPCARQWQSNKGRHYSSSLPIVSWAGPYTVFLTVLCVGIYYFSMASGGEGLKNPGAFGNTGTNPFVQLDKTQIEFNGSFLQQVLRANIPQFVLSVCYILFNNLLTHLHMAKEWAMMSTDFRGLRVTSPRGEQRSTYTLQLPLRWSIPSIMLSILLHWLASNSLYVFLSEGGFFSTGRNSDTSINISQNGFIGLGYSVVAIFATLMIFILMMLIPLAIGRRRLPGDMVIVGTNSWAISAACHASALSAARYRTETPGRDKASMRSDEDVELLRSAQSFMSAEAEARAGGRFTETETLNALAESKIRWGVVAMPESFYDSIYQDTDVGKVEHLSFGCAEDAVAEPKHGAWYS